MHFQKPIDAAGGAVAIFSGTDGNASDKRGLIAFDIADNIPAGSTINSVQLTLLLELAAGNVTSGNQTINLRRLTADRGEGTTGAG